MLTMALLALAIFVVFAVVGGLAVWFVVRNQSQERQPGDPPPRGFPREDT